jgi:transcriptional regulator with XRE-family HTH domain
MTNTRDPEDVRVGATIKALRKAHELKQVEMAVALGISHAYLSNIEAGRKAAPMALCRQAAKILRVPLAAITVEGYEQIREAAEEAKAAEQARPAA